MTERPPRSSDAVGLGVLRAAITVLVVLHHAALAYHPYAPPPFDSLTRYPFWQAFPVVDPDRWSGALWIVAVNDTFFMSLMFLLSGVFVWRGLSARGPARYLAGRARRLGLPFLLAAGVLAPLAYLPSYLQTGAAASWSGFWHTWLALDSWPAGPAWFLWLLLAFDVVAVALRGVLGGPIAAFGRLLGKRAPGAFAILLALSAAAYLPLALAHGALDWTAVGPFAFQTSRVLHYAVYFAIGLAIGAAPLDAGLLAPRGTLARWWLAWLALAIAAFVVAAVLVLSDAATGGTPLASYLGFVVSCAALCFAFLAGFLRIPWPRAAFASLRRNAYAIFVLHYALVSWLQYALLGAALPAWTKLATAFLGALALSWATAALARRLRPGAPAVADPA